jgi:AraC family transcriptional regulator
VTQVERVVYQNSGIEVGAFRLPAGRADFGRAGPIRDHCVFAFPRTSVWIRHEGQRPFLADSSVVTLYNPGQPYARGAVDPRGDLSDWFAVETGMALEVARELDPALEDRPQRPFRFSHGPSDASTYLAQRTLFHVLERGGTPETLGVEEQLLALLGGILRLAYAAGPQGWQPRPGSLSPRERDAVEHTRHLLVLHFQEPLTLAELARTVGLGRYRLCRAFRRAVGTTLHGYREQLRLREGLRSLAGRRADLTTVALDLGYSSHSHFTARFRGVFGATPSQVRSRLAAPQTPRARRADSEIGSPTTST